jgi:hypothetical protein
MTRQQQQICNNYESSKIYSVEQAYKNCSYYKTRAEKSIIDEMIKNNGWGYKILGYNCSQFSCAYLMQDEDGVIKIVYHTASNKKVFVFLN